MGTQKLKKVPMGTGSLKWGPTWEQWRQVVLGLQKPLTVERGEKLVGEITLSPDFTQHRLTNYQTISDM